MASNAGIMRKLTNLVSRKETSEDVRGSYGLQLLYAPAMTIVDFVFVHGLGGGSRSTWSQTDEIESFWPQEWLHREGTLENARCHSFGYNADWTDKKNSAFDVHDFGKALLQALADSPDLRNRQDCPIVLIGHSMGGLVIKWAFMLTQQDPAFKDLKRRIQTLFFLGTPHRGADLAKFLNNVLHITYGPNLYVGDLQETSKSLQHLNEEFRHCVEGLQLYSFYETREIDVIIGSKLVVPKHSAILDYANEMSAPLLDTDHRGMTKYGSREDPNYLAVRNALITATESIRSKCKEATLCY